jgi:hypothetical protein
LLGSKAVLNDGREKNCISLLVPLLVARKTESVYPSFLFLEQEQNQ